MSVSVSSSEPKRCTAAVPRAMAERTGSFFQTMPDRKPPPAYRRAALRSHCTLPVTVAIPLSVNVQVFVLLPPLEHAPDQMASRPLLTLKVIELLVAKLAD